MAEGSVDQETKPASPPTFREYAQKKGLDPARLRKSLEGTPKETEFSLIKEEERQVKENQSWIERIFAKLRKERESTQAKVETPPTAPATQEKIEVPAETVIRQEVPEPVRIGAVTEPSPEQGSPKPAWLRKQEPILAEKAKAHGISTGPLRPTPAFKEQVAARALEQLRGTSPTPEPEVPPVPEPEVQEPEERPLERIPLKSILKGQIK